MTDGRVYPVDQLMLCWHESCQLWVGLPWELLWVEDLVVIADSEKDVIRKFDGGGFIYMIFAGNLRLSQKWYKIRPWLLWNIKRKS